MQGSQVTQNRDSFLANFRYRKNWKRATYVLSIFVVIGTIASLMLPAITLNQYVCGQAEHTHTAACSTEAVLTCELAEHTHTDACRQDPMDTLSILPVSDVELMIRNVPAASEIEQQIQAFRDKGDQSGQAAYCEKLLAQFQAAFDAYLALTEEQRALVENAAALLECEYLLEVLPDYIPKPAGFRFRSATGNVNAAVASGDSLPGDAEFQVAQLPEGAAQFAQTQDAVSTYLAETETTLNSMVLLDMHFIDAAGAEIDCGGSTSVTLNFNTPILPGEGTVRALHITDSGIVDVTGHVTRDETGVTAVSLTTEGFSLFALALTNPTDRLIDSGHVENGTAEGITWELVQHEDGSRTLTFSGAGEIPDYKGKDANGNVIRPPWVSYCSTATKLVLGEGITRTGYESFKDWNLTEIVFPASLHTIGERSFGYISGPVSITIPGTVKTVENSAFIYSRAPIAEYILQEGTEYIGNDAFGIRVEADKTSYIPASVTHVGTRPFWSSAAYEVHPDNPTVTAVDGVLFSKDKTILWDYPDCKIADVYIVPAHTKVLKSGALRGASTSTREFRIEHVIEFDGVQNFRDCGFQKMYFTDGLALSNGWMFVGNSSMQEVRLPENTPYKIGSDDFGSNRQLASFKVPNGTTSIANTCFYNMDSLTSFLYDAANATIADKPINPAQNGLSFLLTVGPNVDRLPANFSRFVAYANEVVFTRDNAFYVESGAFDGALEPLNTLSGWVYVALDGTLYTLDAQTGQAKLFYCQSDCEVLTVPETITTTLENGEAATFRVTSVEKNALKHAGALSSVIFEDVSKITRLEAYALANAPIESITDQASGRTVTTVTEAEELFGHASLGYGVFNNTLLGNAPILGPGFGENMNGGQSLYIETEDTKASIGITVTAGKTTQWQENTDGTGGYSSLTGDQVAFAVAISNTTAVEQKYRVYIQKTAEDCSIPFTPGESYTVEDIRIFCTETEDPNTICLEFTADEGQTVSINIDVLYSSPDSLGGGAVLRVALVDQEGTEHMAAGTIQASWKTAPVPYNIQKTNSSVNAIGITTDEYGTRLSEGLRFMFSLVSDTAVDDAYGKDYVTFTDYVDVITLPDGVSWDPAVLQAIDAKELISLGSAVYLDTNPRVPIITFGNVNGTRSLQNIRLIKNEQGQIELRWRIKNTGAVDIPTGTFNVTFERRAFVVDMARLDLQTEGEALISNTVDLTISYTHTPQRNVSSTVTKRIAGGSGRIDLTKTGTQAKYLGEDITYTLRLYNNGGLAWESDQAGLHTMTDTLSAASFISAENMALMLRQAAEDGTPLTITVQNAALGTASSVTGIDGSSVVYLNGNNSDLPDACSATAVITLADGLYTVTVEDRVEKGADLKEVLHRFGFGVAQDTVFTCSWALNDPAQKLVLAAGQVIERNIYATAKTTFQYIGTDWPNQYPRAQSVLVMNQKATVQQDGGKRYRESGNVSSSVYREAALDKYVSLDGQRLNSNPTAADGEVLDYTLTLTHYGSGIYDDLPLVDDLCGSQYLLVPVDKNPGLSDLETLEHNGTQYYVLKEGSYTNVWAGQDEQGSWLNAATITVTRASDQTITTTGSANTFSGIHTQIKWYFDHLDGGSWQKKITYPALIDAENRMTYTIGNIAWMNDNVGSRVHAGLWGGGTLINYDKQILVQRGETPYQDVLDEDAHTAVGQGEQVTYRLELSSTGNAGSFTVLGQDLADSLPHTYGIFEWGQADIQIEAVPVFSGEEGSPNSITGWQDLATKWSVRDNYNSMHDPGRYFLCWEDDVTLVFRENATVYLYVTLTYPTNTVEDAVWSNYAGAVSGAMVDNTFFVQMNPASVTHVLKEPGSVRLQKGVYAPARAGTGGETSKLFAAGSSRMYYNNQDSTTRMVVYYVTLHNGGASRLYLNDMQDRMPEGFTFLAMMADPSRLKGGVAHNDQKTITTAGGASSPFVTETNDITYRSAQVTVNVSGSTLSFSFSDGGNSYPLLYDEERNQYYLDKNEAIVFGYVLQVGSVAQTMDEAINTVAMPYTDYTGAGLGICEEGRYTADDLDGRYAEQNNGGCTVRSAAEVQARYGFADEENRQWLVSDVTMIRGGIRPGIQKQTVSYQHEVGGQKYDYTNSVVASDIVNWQATLSNNGDMTIVDYTIQDTMPTPYIFFGDVDYAVYDDSDRLIDSSTLFTVESVGDDLSTLQDLQTITVKRGSTVYNVGIGAEPVKIRVSHLNREYDMSLGFAWDENHNLVMSLLMTDVKLGVPEGGRLELMYSSYNPTTTSESTTYLNSVSLLPTQPFTQSAIGTGMPVRDENGKLIGLSNISPVTVSTGFGTDAYKKVEQYGADSARSDDSNDNSIVLEDPMQGFTYSLVVENGKENTPTLTRLVLIDNLPYVGDVYTYNESLDRNSEYSVYLAQAPNFRVVVTDEQGVQNLLRSGYTIEFSKKQSEFTLEERSGEAHADWVTMQSWTESRSNVRSIRVILEESAASLIKPGSSVTVSFDARADESAATGAYAWNNFGYRYSYVAGNQVIEMEAMPVVVGVRIQSEPFLSKVLVHPDGSSAVLEEDQTFRFLVYTGEALPGSYATQTELEAALRENERAFGEWAVTVPAGSSESAVEKLVSAPFNWVTGNKYTIVELLTDGAADETQFRQWKQDGALVSDQNSYTFTYDKDRLIELACVNTCRLWDLELTKTDAKTNAVLEGAIFALYGREDIGFAQDGAAPTTVIENETWYLHRVATTGADGKAIWSDLDQEEYYLLELRAPNGYMLSMAPQHILRPQDSRLLTLALTNSSGVLLPATGAAGTLSYTFSGWAVMAIACALLYGIKRKQRRGAR